MWCLKKIDVYAWKTLKVGPIEDEEENVVGCNDAVKVGCPTDVVICTATNCPNLYGRDGRNGAPGRDGATVIGPAGRDGLNGLDGKDCVECAQGPLGPKGNVGATGKDGKQGMKGEKGVPGIRGSKGEKGLPGQKGVAGVEGDMGDEGVCDTKVLNALLKDIQSLKSKVNQLTEAFNGKKIKQSYLPAGYNKFSAFDMQWQSLHMSAAAACRGSADIGGRGATQNYVYPRKHGVNCRSVCEQTNAKNCDGEVSLHGLMGKATKYYSHVGYYFNYGCHTGNTWGDEVKIANEQISEEMVFTSYCCCRK